MATNRAKYFDFCGQAASNAKCSIQLHFVDYVVTCGHESRTDVHFNRQHQLFKTQHQLFKM
jgi:hypothetical protein